MKKIENMMFWGSFTLCIKPSSITELLMPLYSSNKASTSLTLTAQTKSSRSNKFVNIQSKFTI